MQRTPRFPSRLASLSMALVLMLILVLSASAAWANEAGWNQFKQRFVTADGRVIDTDQGNISHSEGQGFGLLFAVHYGDRATFERIWQWTRKHLQVRSDHLLAWRWEPQSGVTDKNDASDGDLLVAWSLLRAADKWHAPEYLQASREIARDIREKLLKQAPQGLVLLPGEAGFDKPEGITINLSYWVFPALDEIGRADPSPQWHELVKTGMTILGYARFGRWGLPPDWLILTKMVAPSPRFPKHFGYDAVRIPLYLLWSRRETPELLKPYRDFWNYFQGAKFLPAWADLSDDSVDTHGASPGMRRLSQWVLDYPRTPVAGQYSLDDKSYYSSVLLLLEDMAIGERKRPK